MTDEDFPQIPRRVTRVTSLGLEPEEEAVIPPLINSQGFNTTHETIGGIDQVDFSTKFSLPAPILIDSMKSLFASFENLNVKNIVMEHTTNGLVASYNKKPIFEIKTVDSITEPGKKEIRSITMDIDSLSAPENKALLKEVQNLFQNKENQFYTVNACPTPKMAMQAIVAFGADNLQFDDKNNKSFDAKFKADLLLACKDLSPPVTIKFTSGDELNTSSTMSIRRP